ncbi:MAG TPA: protealysin inhibitor emfourin [Actinomycetota bacterium]|jgi:hypothetical protein|nr:protealysin inhibitor emfourin [Actinomycetota bacterium]
MTPQFTFRLERQGGFAGIPMSAVVSSSELEGDEAARLWAMVDRDALASATAATVQSAGPTRPDSLTYRLVVETPDSRDEYHFGEEAVGPQLQPLVQRLEQSLSI